MSQHRATVLVRTQIGPEATPGVAVPANRALLGASIEVKVDAPTQLYTAKGYKQVTTQWNQPETCGLSFEGIADFNEIGWFLAAINRPVTTALGGGAFKHEFTPSTKTADLPLTYTVQNGDPLRAIQATYGMFTGVTLDLSLEECKVSGEGWARPGTEGIVMTPNAVEVDTVPIIGMHWTHYLSESADPADMVALEVPFKANFAYTGTRNKVQGMNRANPAFIGHVDLAPEFKASITLEANSEGESFLPALRASKPLFAQSEAIGDLIDGSDERYSLIINAPFYASNVGAPEDEEGVSAISYDLTGRYDRALGRSIKYTLINTTPSYA